MRLLNPDLRQGTLPGWQMWDSTGCRLGCGWQTRQQWRCMVVSCRAACLQGLC